MSLCVRLDRGEGPKVPGSPRAVTHPGGGAVQASDGEGFVADLSLAHVPGSQRPLESVPEGVSRSLVPSI